MHQHKDVTKPETEKECADVQQWYGTTFTNNKAGMAAVDKEKVKRVVYEMSKARAQDTSFRYLCTVVCASTPTSRKDISSASAQQTVHKSHVSMQDTPHFKHGLRLQGQTEERIRRLKEQQQKMTAAELASHTRYSSPNLLPGQKAPFACCLSAKVDCLYTLIRADQ